MKEVECSWCLGMKQIWNEPEKKMIQCPECKGTGSLLRDDDYDDENTDEGLFTQFDEELHSLEGGDDD